MNVKLNDNVVVITGKDAGKQGKVIATSPKNNTVTVEGVNLQSKAKKARKAKRLCKEGAIDVSNVMVVCAGCGKGVRVKHQIVDGKKVRVCGKCGAVLDTAYAGKGKGKAAEVKEAPKKRTRKRAAKAEGAATEAQTPAEDKAE